MAGDVQKGTALRCQSCGGSEAAGLAFALPTMCSGCISDLMGDYESNDCPTCGGQGVLDDECECEAIEDVCCCLHPTPRRCTDCGGRG